MAFVEYNMACPDCNSSDAFAIDDGGWGTCFSCGSRVPPTDGDSRVASTPVQKADTEAYNASQGISYADLSDRKITRETCLRYGVGWRGDDLAFPIGESISSD